jgi:hypothetical protein
MEGQRDRPHWVSFSKAGNLAAGQNRLHVAGISFFSQDSIIAIPRSTSHAMRTINLVLGVAAVALLTVAGCGKSDKTPPPPQVQGVTVDIPKLNQAFENASSELKATSTAVGFNVRYGKYEDALMALDKLANDPNVNAEQKKVVNQLIEEVKQLANAAPPAAAPAQ